MAFFVVEGLGLALIPRAASSAIQNAIVASGRPLSEVDLTYFTGLPQRIAFIREPHERIESAYRLYQHSEDPRFDLSSFPAFVRSVCEDNHQDPHVMPQWDLIKDSYPTQVIGWDFSKLANILGLESIPVDNESPPTILNWDPNTLELFNQVETLSLKLWEVSKVS